MQIICITIIAQISTIACIICISITILIITIILHDICTIYNHQRVSDNIISITRQLITCGKVAACLLTIDSRRSCCYPRYYGYYFVERRLLSFDYL